MKRLTEQIISIFIDGLKDTVKRIIKKREFKNMLKENVNFLARNESNPDFFNNELSVAFNDKEIKKIYKELIGKSGYDLKSTLETRLNSILRKCEVDETNASYFVSNFIDSVLTYIKNYHPDLFVEYKLNEIFELNKKTNENTLIILEEMKDIKKNLMKDDKISIKTTDEIDSKLKETLRNGIGIDFFNSDDSNFIFEFEKRIKNNELIINIISQSIYEARLMVLNELKKYSKDVIAVLDEESWNKLKNNGIKNHVLIPYFNSNIIPAIEGNINIFIFNDEYPCSSRDKLFIRKRLKKTIENNLIKYGYDSNEAYQLATDTHGVFAFLMNKLFIGKHTIYPDYKDDQAILSVALLLGEWTEADGDKQLIETLSGIKYSVFIKTINKYCFGENPLFIKYKEYSSVHYALTSKEDAWNKFEKLIDNTLWTKFINFVPSIFVEIEPKLNISNANTEENMLCNETSGLSKILKNGILKTLVFISCYFDRNERTQKINSVIKKILNNVNSCAQWENISEYICELVEIDPEIVLDSIEKELNYNTGLIDLFKLKKDQFLETNHYYKYLWAMEQLLLQADYACRVIELLFKLNELDIKYSLTNSPKDLLEKVFCPWINVSVIDGEKKVILAEKYVSKYKNAIKIIIYNLPGSNRTITGQLCYPKYRFTDEIKDVAIGEYYSVCQKYIELCISKSDMDNQYAEKVISSLLKYTTDINFINNGINRVVMLYSKLDDNRKEKLKTFLRGMIHDHRYYNTADWAVKEEIIEIFENAMNSIVLDNKVYEYKYLFISSINFPLLNPIPYKKEDFDATISKNDELREREIGQKINEFKKNNYDLGELISICDINNNTLGYYIFKYFSKESYDENICKLILDNYKVNSVVTEYARTIYYNTGSDSYNKLIEFSINQGINNDNLVDMLRFCSIDRNTIDLFVSLDDDVKVQLWELGVSAGNDIDVVPALVQECKKYGSIGAYINFIYSIKRRISVEEVYNYMMECLSDEFVKYSTDALDEYRLEKLLKLIEPYAESNPQRRENMVKLELMFYKVLKWDNMHFMSKEMKSNPKTYAQLLAIVFKRKDKDHTEEQKKLGRLLWSLYSNAKFCPAEKNGKVDEEELRTWVKELKEQLALQGQDYLLSIVLGHLFAHSPMEKDGVPLAYAVREIIEENYTDSLRNEFWAEEMNKRGVYSPSGGEQEKELSLRYKKYADILRCEYPACAKIYDCISDDYKEESLREREREEYAD